MYIRYFRYPAAYESGYLGSTRLPGITSCFYNILRCCKKMGFEPEMRALHGSNLCYLYGLAVRSVKIPFYIDLTFLF